MKVGVCTMFESKIYKVVQGEIMFLKGVHNGTLYKIIGSNFTNGCNNFVVPEGGNEEYKTFIVSREKKIIWNQIIGNIGDKGLKGLHGKCMVVDMTNCTLDVDFC